jgi:hypothetical protein
MYRDRARTYLQQPILGLRLGHLVNLNRDTRITQLAPAMTAKTRAPDLQYGAGIPSLHQDPSLRSGLLAKEAGRWPVLSSGNTTSPYCQSVMRHGCLANEVLIIT